AFTLTQQTLGHSHSHRAPETPMHIRKFTHTCSRSWRKTFAYTHIHTLRSTQTHTHTHILQTWSLSDGAEDIGLLRDKKTIIKHINIPARSSKQPAPTTGLSYDCCLSSRCSLV